MYALFDSFKYRPHCNDRGDLDRRQGRIQDLWKGVLKPHELPLDPPSNISSVCRKISKEQVSSKRLKFAFAPFEDSDQPVHLYSLIRVLDGHSKGNAKGPMFFRRKTETDQNARRHKLI